MGEFEENGYVVVPNAIPGWLCDVVVAAYQREVKPCADLLARFGSRGEKLLHKFDAFGHVKNAVGWRSANALTFPQLRVTAREAEGALGKIVTELCGPSNYLNAGLFEVSSGFLPHQDAYFSTVETDGRAIWLALEDINPNAGPLFVCPNSRSWVFWPRKDEEEKYTADLVTAVKDGTLTKVPMLLKKGDAVIFDSMTVHGAEPVIDPSLSRYALSLHYGR